MDDKRRRQFIDDCREFIHDAYPNSAANQTHDDVEFMQMVNPAVSVQLWLARKHLPQNGAPGE